MTSRTLKIPNDNKKLTNFKNQIAIHPLLNYTIRTKKQRPVPARFLPSRKNVRFSDNTRRSGKIP
jgi:hypothetical protein